MKQPVVTVAAMRESDAYTIAHLVPSKTLMYRAAMGVALAVEWKGRIGILAGSGNNGGDGYALACILADRGVPCELWRVSEKFSEDGQYYHDRAVEKGVPVSRFTPETALEDYDILVDCLLGTGFAGTPRDLFQKAIQAINASGAYVVSVDINSGLNGDTGLGELAVRSDLTVTIGFLKTGFFQGDSAAVIGALTVADIGIRLLEAAYFLEEGETLPFPLRSIPLEDVSGSDPILVEKETR
ncbi:MAG: NAD(P)H-hydrate epimerase [Ruminiclostridium sp.]|jgi:hydroxyethylthiazole kinase-like uncharacterized protein yjeF|nr:NAD(P)H-hydrate epimerase [Ruminiclostridium sp.]